MPFTGSHPAAVLPFLRSGLPPSALVIGSMAPDFPYYFQIATVFNPFPSSLEQPPDWRTLVLSLWAGLMLVANMGWMRRQARAFPDLRDPFDRLIAGTAAALGVPLISPDARIAAAGRVRILW